jgi:hypothetical protein
VSRFTFNSANTARFDPAQHNFRRCCARPLCSIARLAWLLSASRVRR